MKVKIFACSLTNILAFLTFNFCGKQNELIKQLRLTMHTSNMPANNILGFYCLNDEGILSESGAETKLWDICFFIARVYANVLNVVRFESCPVNQCYVKCHDIHDTMLVCVRMHALFYLGWRDWLLATVAY